MLWEYSVSEAKTHFSQILREVREGKTVTISYRGKPVAEIRSILGGPFAVEERLEDLERRGILVHPAGPRQPLKMGPRRSGALKRFLVERDE